MPKKLTPPPEWLFAMGRALNHFFAPLARLLAWLFGGAAPLVKWAAIGVAILALAALVRALVPLARAWLRARKAPPVAELETPFAEAGRALLAQADLLAGQCQWDEAVHLLLRHSVNQIAQARPDMLDPASTAREIGRIAALPATARAAFGVIAARVERSRYAARALVENDWQAARAAYADFAATRIAPA